MRKLDHALDFATLTGALVFGLVKLILWLPPVTYIDIITGFAVVSIATLVFATLSMLLHQPTRLWIEEENERLREMVEVQAQAEIRQDQELLAAKSWLGTLESFSLTSDRDQTPYYGANRADQG